MVEKTTDRHKISVKTANRKDENNTSTLLREFYIETTEIGINKKVNSVTIGEKNAVTLPSHKNVCVNNNDLVLALGTEVYCFEVPTLRQKWKVTADRIECMEIVGYEEDYIAHGGHYITRISSDGKIRWKRQGKDIFSLPTGGDNFLTDKHFITVRDWSNRKYVFDYNGRKIKIYGFNYLIKRWLSRK